MTIQPSRQQFAPLISGNVRTADLVSSIAKEIERIVEVGTRCDPPTQRMRELAAKLRRLAETIEKGER